jgi:hypothetical protein
VSHAALPFAPWESFYVIVGSSAAALTGLQFVVIVLGAEINVFSESALRSFGTPTIVHLCAALLTSAVLSAPWTGLLGAAICLAILGVTGFLYVLVILLHARRQTDYVPVLEDWLWHFILPGFAYTTFLASGIALVPCTATALFVLGGAVLLLLFIGIHNAWDSVTYMAMKRSRKDESAGG